MVELFHPRRDIWIQHFEWLGIDLVGKTATGRATVLVLAVNAPDFRAVRESLTLEEKL